MTTKQWLNRGKRLDNEINTLLNVKRSLSDHLTSITQNYNSDGAQSTKDPHKFDQLVIIDNDIDQRIDELANIRREIFNAINQVDDPRYRQILMGRYISSWTWEQIAVSIGYSFMQTTRLHGYALKAIEPIIKQKM